jgi:glycosyltransferase involved in cell wall biosynthesis
MMISVLIPAHNEQDVIGLALNRLLDGAAPGEVQIVVVCNGCSDRTAEVARAAAPGITVIESSIPSKSEAINTGMEACSGECVVVADADVSMNIEDLRRLAAGLRAEGVLAAAPAVRMEYLPGTSWGVRAFYRFWMSLPYVKEGMMAAGVWALNQAGRKRVGRLPRIISDDGYVRLLFAQGERIEVGDAVSVVLAPLTIPDLIKIKTRSRLGWYELRARFPELLAQEVGKRRYAGAWIGALANPGLWLAAIPYLYVNLLARRRASRQSRSLASYRWERDEGSRRASAAKEAASRAAKG